MKAVVFDYGLVLSGPRAQWAIDAAYAATGLQRDSFEVVYWKFRDSYDDGTLDGAGYWRRSLEDAGIAATPALVEELVRLDGAMWCTQNDALVAWLQIMHSAGVKTAILSNMGDRVRAAIESECAWVREIDVRVWSHELGYSKPDPRIYRHTLEQLGVEPGEALFLDDREENVATARRCGMLALVYSTVDQLRRDLDSIELLSALPPV